MLAVQWSRHGEPAEVAELVELPEPAPPGPGEARLAPKYAPINPADLLRMQGRYGNAPTPLPALAGGEGVARVEALGAGVGNVRVGDRVLVPLGRGSWRQALNVPAAALFALPQADPLQLAMAGINPPTAWQLLHDIVALREGDWIAQNAAASAVGRMVIRLARRSGVRTANIVRHASQVDELRALGADEVFVAGPALQDEVAARLREPVRLGIDAVAGSATGTLARMVAEGGTVVTYGLLSGEPCAVAARDLVFRDVRLRGYWLARSFTPESAPRMRRMYEQLVELLRTGELATPVAGVHALRDVHAALRHAAQSARGGKVLLRIG